MRWPFGQEPPSASVGRLARIPHCRRLVIQPQCRTATAHEGLQLGSPHVDSHITWHDMWPGTTFIDGLPAMFGKDVRRPTAGS